MVVMEVASLKEGEWPSYRSGQFNREKWSCYRGGQFNGGSMVMLQKWIV